MSGLKARLDNLDGELSLLETRVKQAKADSLGAYEAKQNHSELQSAGENAWEHLKRGAEETRKPGAA